MTLVENAVLLTRIISYTKNLHCTERWISLANDRLRSKSYAQGISTLRLGEECPLLSDRTTHVHPLGESTSPHFLFRLKTLHPPLRKVTLSHAQPLHTPCVAQGSLHGVTARDDTLLLAVVEDTI
jgi:hypothetical protein